MTALLFTLRKSQLKRKLSQVQMNQMNITSQLQRVTAQISSAQQAKAAKAQLFGSTMRQNRNAIQTMFGLSYQQKMFLSNQEMYTNKQDFDKIQQYATFLCQNGIERTENNRLKIKDFDTLQQQAPELASALIGAGLLVNTGAPNNPPYDGTFVQEYEIEGKKVQVTQELINKTIYEALSNEHHNIIQNAMNNQLNLQNDYIDMQKMMNTQNFMTNTFNMVNDFIDGNELESLNALQTQLQATKDALEAEAAQIKTELDATEKAEDEARKKDAPKY